MALKSGAVESDTRRYANQEEERRETRELRINIKQI